MRPALLLALVALSGCGARYEAMRSCQRESGPQPYGVGEMFGVAGSLVQVSTPDHRVWRGTVADCVDRRMAGFR